MSEKSPHSPHSFFQHFEKCSSGRISGPDSSNVLPLLRAPAWQIYCSGRPMSATSHKYNELLTLPVEQLIREELLVLVSSESFSRAQTLVNLLKYIVDEPSTARWKNSGSDSRRTRPGAWCRFQSQDRSHREGSGRAFGPNSNPTMPKKATGHGVLIEIPKGAYVATFRVRAEDTAQASTAPVRKVPKLAIALLVASAVAGGITLAVRQPWVDRPVPSVALVSFADLSQTHDQRYLSDGISQQLVHALTRISGLKVVGGFCLPIPERYRGSPKWPGSSRFLRD